MWSTLDPPSLKLARPLTLTTFIFAHSTNYLLGSGTIELAKECAQHYGPTILQGVSFTGFEII